MCVWQPFWPAVYVQVKYILTTEGQRLEEAKRNRPSLKINLNFQKYRGY